MKSLGRVRLLATPWTAAHQAPHVHGIFQARVLEWGATVFSNNEFLHSLIYLLPNLPWGEGSKKYFFTCTVDIQ